MPTPQHRHCPSCFFSTEFPGIAIESNGRCNVCNSVSSETGSEGQQTPRIEELRQAVEEFRDRRGGRYDCIIGASGGLDSSYVLYVAKVLLGLNPLVLNYDSGFALDLARENLRTICRQLGVDLRVVRSKQENDLKYVRSMALALRGTDLFWGVCRFCHYILPAVVYKHALEEGIPLILTSRNEYESQLHMPRRFKRRLMLRALFRRGGIRLPRFLYYSALARFYLLRLKLEFYLPPLSNLFSGSPKKPPIVDLNVTRYVPWEVDSMVKTLEEAGWRAPADSRLPMRFDCLIEEGFVNHTYKRAGGITIHGIICNNMIYRNIRTKAELEEDVAHYDAQVGQRVEETMARLGLK